MINDYLIKKLERVVNTLISCCNQNEEFNLIPEISKAIPRLRTNITSYQQSLSLIQSKEDSPDKSKKISSLQVQLLHDIASPLAMLGFWSESKKISLSQSNRTFICHTVGELRIVYKEIKNNILSANFAT